MTMGVEIAHINFNNNNSDNNTNTSSSIINNKSIKKRNCPFYYYIILNKINDVYRHTSVVVVVKFYTIK